MPPSPVVLGAGCVKPASLGSYRRWLLAGTLAIVAVRLLWGHAHCAEGLPFYSTDENDVVEPAAGVLMGDWNHQYYGYGPVFMYLLSLLYVTTAFLSGSSIHQFAIDVFFDHSSHYYLARLFSLVVILATLTVAVMKTERLFSVLAAALCLLVLAFPVTENFTKYTARIDVLQGFFQLLALFSLVRIFTTGARRHYVFAAIWVGLAIATKPIPGAVIVPVALAVVLLRIWRETAPALSGRGIIARGWPIIRAFASDRRLYWAIGAEIAAFSIGFPFAVLDFKNFWPQTLFKVRFESAKPYPLGSELVQYVPQAGWFLCALGVVALLYQFWRGSAAGRIIAAFAALYLLVFFRLPARQYFFVPILAPVAICISLLLADLLRRCARFETRFALVAVVALGILVTLPRPRGFSRQRQQLAMQSWITSNLPNGTKLCTAGWFTKGPRLVSSQAETESQNDYFMYGRDKNPRYVAAFLEAHRNYLLAGRPAYDIAYWGRRDLSSAEARAELLEFCRAHHSRYLVLGGVPPFPPLPDPLLGGGGVTVFKLEVERPGA